MIAPLLRSLHVVALALAAVVPAGIALGWWLARTPRRALRTAVDALVVLPMVMPPSVTGFYLLALFGRRGPVGALLEQVFGLRLVFHATGAALAAAVVSLPLMAKGSEAAFARIDGALEDVARVHGLSAWQTFRAVTLPMARPGLAVALSLTALRALGEFGATLVFAGYAPGATDTAPLELFAALQAGDDGRARDLALALSALSLATTAALAAWSRPRA